MPLGGRTHVPRHDAERCESCGGCTWRCPAAVFPELARERDSLRGALFSARPYPGAPAQFPPCRMACPLGQDVPRYIAAIARGELDQAALAIRETNALPAVCGRVCLASCMRACTRAAIDEGLDIRGLKRFATSATAASAPRPFDLGADAPRVVVVGAGPAGLAAAHRLGQLGIRPLVIEAGARAGGLLATAVPRFVLPREALAADIAALEQQGVSIRTGVRIGRDVSWVELESAHDAVLVATGAATGVRPSIPGADLAGVLHAVELCSVETARPLGPVVVEGGGPSALESARMALRLGAPRVCVVHPLPLELWPAGTFAVEPARAEGVELLPGHRVVALGGANGRLEQVIVQSGTWGPTDGVGRARLPAAGAERAIAATIFVGTTLRRPGRGARPDLAGMTCGPLGNLQVDDAYRLPRPGWYAAGEVATGPGSVVDVMATGRLAAEAISRDLAARRKASG